MKDRYRLVFNSEDILGVLCLYKTLKNKSKTIKKVGISGSTLEKWVKMYDQNRIQTVFDEDDRIPSIVKLNALESYYMTKSLDKAAESVDIDVITVSKWINRFEKQMNEESEEETEGSPNKKAKRE